jgi:hypothetical protein
MADLGADLEYRTGNARGEVLLLFPREDAVPVAAQDQNRTADPGEIQC